jgi:hypothetical protein
LKNSFSGNFNKQVVRKLLNVRWPQTLKFTEITALVPFSTATPVPQQLSRIRDGFALVSGIDAPT